jgi:outer membrane protein OmpA-like peptidoglycan-associated protein
VAEVADGSAGAAGAGAPGSCLDLQKKVGHIQAGGILAACGSEVTVTGHTDNRAPATSPFSQRRADAVAAVLEKAGVTGTKAEGVGGADPIGDNNTAAGRDLNRFAAIVVE